MTNEIGRELRVRDLKPPQVIVLEKPGRPLTTAWVAEVGADHVAFEMNGGPVPFMFIAHREGRDKDEIGDDTHRMKMYEYLGTV